MKFETRIRCSYNGFYYPQYRKVYLNGWLKTNWSDLYSECKITNSVTRCWGSLTEAKQACQELLDSRKLTCTKDMFIYP